MSVKVKIVNDPVYGFIRFPERELMEIIDHPWFQRLRRIKQMGLADFVYPGAVHTRFAHSLGACHLAGKAMDELIAKEVNITKEDYLATRLAALLHDVGHGPYSHSLERALVGGVSHEFLSKQVMLRMNEEFGGLLTPTIEIFEHEHPKDFLHKLVSSQLDVDRMDYLNRDSFYTGVSEGVIGYDRILQMLTVKDNELLVEEKGVQSVEKFIIARRLMYWQVYLHKTVLGAEMLLINILRRAKELYMSGMQMFASPALSYFLARNLIEDDFKNSTEHLDVFCMMDDADVLGAIKVWQNSEDKVLSRLCKMLLLRKLYKVVYSSESLDEQYEERKKKLVKEEGFSEDELSYFIVKGVTSNNTYNTYGDLIRIETKAGEAKNITEINDTLVNNALAGAIHKNYICYTQQ